MQRAFVGKLSLCGVVAAAARSVGRSPSSAYQLRRRAGEDSGFARAWDTALARAGGRTLDEAMASAMRRVRTPVWRHGRKVGVREARWGSRQARRTIVARPPYGIAERARNVRSVAAGSAVTGPSRCSHALRILRFARRRAKEMRPASGGSRRQAREALPRRAVFAWSVGAALP